jgi:DNA-binding transcriptional regulator LsrR (DeoR family)
MNQEPLTGKKKRMMEAARLRHMENNSNSEIADKLNLSTGTVDNYFSSNEMQQFKRFYSDQESTKLKKSLKQDVQDATDLSYDLLTQVIKDEQAEPNTLKKAVNEGEKISQRNEKMMKMINQNI